MRNDPLVLMKNNDKLDLNYILNIFLHFKKIVMNE